MIRLNLENCELDLYDFKIDVLLLTLLDAQEETITDLSSTKNIQFY